MTKDQVIPALSGGRWSSTDADAATPGSGSAPPRLRWRRSSPPARRTTDSETGAGSHALEAGDATDLESTRAAPSRRRDVDP